MNAIRFTLKQSKPESRGIDTVQQRGTHHKDESILRDPVTLRHGKSRQTAAFDLGVDRDAALRRKTECIVAPFLGNGEAEANAIPSVAEKNLVDREEAIAGRRREPGVMHDARFVDLEELAEQSSRTGRLAQPPHRLGPVLHPTSLIPPKPP